MPAKHRPDRTVQMPAEEMSKLITHNLAVKDLPPIDTNDAEAVDERLHLYFDMCIESGFKPTVSGMALALKYSRSAITNIVSGAFKKPQDVREIVTFYHDLCTAMMESYMTENKINPVSGIFLMKNNHGYRDQSEVIVANTGAFDVKPESELEKKYLMSIADLPEADAKVIEGDTENPEEP